MEKQCKSCNRKSEIRMPAYYEQNLKVKKWVRRHGGSEIIITKIYDKLILSFERAPP